MGLSMSPRAERDPPLKKRIAKPSAEDDPAVVNPAHFRSGS